MLIVHNSSSSSVVEILSLFSPNMLKFLLTYYAYDIIINLLLYFSSDPHVWSWVYFGTYIISDR